MATAAGSAPASAVETVVEVTVMSGKDLTAADSNGFSDPYVEVCVVRKGWQSLDGKSMKPKKLDCEGNIFLTTPVIKKTLNPVWTTGNVVTLKVLPDQVILFRLWDHDTITAHDSIGVIEYGPIDVFPMEGNKEVFDLDVQSVFKKGLLGNSTLQRFTGSLNLSVKTISCGAAVPIKDAGHLVSFGDAKAPASLHEVVNPNMGTEFYDGAERLAASIQWKELVRSSPAAYFRALVAIHIENRLGEYFAKMAQSNAVASGNATEDKPIFQKVFDEDIVPCEAIAQLIAKQTTPTKRLLIYRQIDLAAKKNAEVFQQSYWIGGLDTPIKPEIYQKFADFTKAVAALPALQE